MSAFEQEIKQSSFKSNKHKAILNLVYTSNWIRDINNKLFKEYGILSQHYNVLRIVRGKKGEPSSPGQIIEVMLDKGRDLTRLVDKLVKMGYLERKTCETNRRKVDIFITDKGLELTQIIEDKLDSWYSKVLKITDEECEQLSLLLDKVRQ